MQQPRKEGASRCPMSYMVREEATDLANTMMLIVEGQLASASQVQLLFGPVDSV